MSTQEWHTQFAAVYERGVTSWSAGTRSAATMWNEEDKAFLTSIGCTPQELFDFVDDYLEYGEPDYATTLSVTAIRRDYFLTVMNGIPSPHIGSMADLPAKSAAIDGITWLPRIIEKARLKLRGEMPRELMYGCAGDRHFLSRCKMTLQEFLALVRDAKGDNKMIIERVTRAASSPLQ